MTDMRNEMASEYLTTVQVAGLLNQAAGTLRYWRHEGIGPKSFKLGRSVRYRRADIEAWVTEQYEATAVGGTEAEASGLSPNGLRTAA
ncbi:Predicted transcriptional regulator [Acidipropionibacterium jensenii]|uniref:Predicted transcriptional regulator n=1 Tax=Acidipropionibacterium jensenii TaxID=1749 RepID=A0A3S4WXW0_9ACTN|nr:helix-turn-helix domain-containing protein [Acidipropionibacterium jensenii]VEI03733.1 Predicted transcriptional regulator [Acidipropionibacterium jensenii]